MGTLQMDVSSFKQLVATVPSGGYRTATTEKLLAKPILGWPDTARQFYGVQGTLCQVLQNTRSGLGWE